MTFLRWSTVIIRGLRHRPKSTKEERGEIIGYYAYAHLVNHDRAFEYMNMDEIEELKEKSRRYVKKTAYY